MHREARRTSVLKQLRRLPQFSVYYNASQPLQARDMTNQDIVHTVMSQTRSTALRLIPNLSRSTLLCLIFTLTIQMK